MKYDQPCDNFIAYADGSCIMPARHGGWAVVIYADGVSHKLSGAAQDVTNNIMELTAAIKALECLPDDAVGVVRTDSNYVVCGLTEWRANWERNGWKTANKKPVLNKHLWVELCALKDARPGVRFQWVKGHASDPGNILVDELAQAAARSR